ncbi:MAG: RNA polymerase sigma factor [Oscillospiraceae bacterium]|nr:RNA polymerase sigma factor [Oscillospiraceae bacterium]
MRNVVELAKPRPDFDAILQRYADMVTRLCIVRLGNPHDAEDCFQNVFFKLFRSSEEFESEEHIKAWLIRAALHECANRRRYFLRHPAVSLEEIADFLPPAPEDNHRELLAAVMSLPDADREIILLCYYHGYSAAEAARMMGKNENTVKSRLLRAREKLRKILEE